MREGGTGGTSDIAKAESTGEDPRATGGLISNLSTLGSINQGITPLFFLNA